VAKLKCLHIFNEFLPPTQMWLLDLLSELQSDRILFAKKKSAKHPQLNPLIISKISGNNKSILKRAINKFSSVRNNFLVREIEKLSSEHQVDIIHAHFADVACETMSRALKVPLIVSFYGWDYEMLPYTKPKYAKAYKQLFKIAQCIITEGPHGKQMLIEQGCPEEKIKVIPLGINVGNPVVKKRKSGAALKLVQVASFREKKGQIYTIKAFKKCIEQGLDVQLTLIGDQGDAYSIEVKTLIKDLKLEDDISIVDFIKYDQLQNHLSQNDIFIQPSCYASNRDCEGGAPTTLFHAMHQGLPIIGTDHCDIPFVVEDQVNGLIAKEKNVEDIAKCIRTFATMDDPQFNIFSQNATQRLKSHFDISENAKLLDLAYKEVAKNFSDNI